MTFTAETPLRRFVAYIDPDKKFAIEDKLSQINTLQQLQNIASYGFLRKRLEQHDLHNYESSKLHVTILKINPV